MSMTVSEMSEQLLSTGLVSSEMLTQMLQEITLSGGDDRCETFAEKLVSAGVLTPFQARMATKGKASSLTVGSYVLVEKLGQGGMGQVFRATHRMMKREVALKVISKELVKDQSSIKRFHREVEAAARLNHPNIVTAYDAGEYRGVHFLVMELIDGISLESLVHKSGPLKSREALQSIQQVATGLAYAHRNGIIHRDIKPANLLVDNQGNIKILDMGLARFHLDSEKSVDASALTAAGVMMGTIDFMAPEQAMDSRNADARSDIYSLGCTLHFLLTGTPVFEEDTVMKRLMAHQSNDRPILPVRDRGVQMLFDRMVSRDPAARYQSMEELLEEVDRLIMRLKNPDEEPSRPIRKSISEFTGTISPEAGCDHSGNLHPSASPKGVGPYNTVQPSAFLMETVIPGTGEPAPVAVPQFSADHPSAGIQSRRRPRSQRSLMSLSVIAGTAITLAILGVIVIKVTNRKGEQTLIRVPEGTEINVRAEPGSTVEISQQDGDAVPGTSPSSGETMKSSQPNMDGPRPVDFAAERRVAEWAQSIGASILIQPENQPEVIAPANSLPESNFQVTTLSLPPDSSSFQIKDEDLDRLQVLSGIRSLRLLQCGSVSDRGVSLLASLRSLEELELGFTRVTDSAVERLQELQHLKSLSLAETQVTDEGLQKVLRSLGNLESIQLSAASTDKCLHDLQLFGKLRSVSGLKPHHVTDVSVDALNRCSNIVALNVVGANEGTVNQLVRLRHVEELYLNLSEFGPETVEQLGSIPNLRILSLSDSPKLTAEHIRAAAKLTGLRKLYLSYSQSPGNGVTAADISDFCRLRPDVEVIVDGKLFGQSP